MFVFVCKKIFSYDAYSSIRKKTYKLNQQHSWERQLDDIS